MVSQVLRFGDCTMNIAARELRRAGERVELPPLVFDCIAYLVSHRERAVGRDELVAAVWGRASISDTMLGKAILAARRAVGDDAERQALLRTLPRFGYHWVGAVAVSRDGAEAGIGDDIAAENSSVAVAATANPPPAQLTSEAHSARSQAASVISAAQPVAFSWLSARTGLIVLAMALGAIVLFVLLRPRFSAPPAAVAATPLSLSAIPLPADSCAVLPAEISAETDHAWLRLGVMDLIATRLRGSGLPVLSSDSVVRLAPEGLPSEAAASALRRAAEVQHLLQPALRRSGKQWIARIELVSPDGHRRAVQGEADNPIAAANTAADELLALLGRRDAAPALSPNASLTELLQRVDAARLSDQMDLAQRLLAAATPEQQRDPELRLRQIQFDLRSGALDLARRRSEALLADFSAEAEPVVHARALESLCVALSRAGDLTAALHACDGAIALLRTRNQPLALGRAYNHRGIVHARELRREQAIVDFSNARVVLGAVGDPLLLAMVDGNESAFAMEQGRPAEALPGIVRAGQQFQRFGMRSEFAVAVVNEVEAQLALLQPLEALKASEQNWAQRAQLADPALRQRLAYSRAEALAANGRLAEARSLLDEILHGADAAATPLEQALARQLLARLELEAGEPAAALLLAQSAQAALTPVELALPRARAWQVVVLALLQQDRVAEAKVQLDEFDQWAATAKPQAAILARLAAAALARQRHDEAAAHTEFTAAQREAEAQGRSDIQAQAAAAFAADRLAAGDFATAAVPVGTLARHADSDYAAAVLQWRLYRALGQDAAAATALQRVRRLAGERPLPTDAPVRRLDATAPSA